MTDNTKALAQALMKTKQSPFVNQEDINYALTSQKRWASLNNEDMYKNLKGLTNDWENHSFKELVKLWEYRVTNLNQNDPFEKPEEILKYFEGLFKILETDKIILYSRTSAYFPEYCNVRVQAYRNALMMACHQEALMVAVTGLGIALSKKYTEHILFYRFIFSWDYIHRVIYKTNEDKPTIPPDDVIRKMERHSVVQHSITLFDMMRNLDPEKNVDFDYGKNVDIDGNVQKGNRARKYSHTEILKECESWEGVEIKIVLRRMGGYKVAVRTKEWKVFKDFTAHHFKLYKPNDTMSHTGLILEEIARTGILYIDNNIQLNTFKKRIEAVNKHLKLLFGFPEGKEHYKQFNPIQYDKHHQAYLWKLGTITFEEFQGDEKRDPDNMRGAYFVKTDADLQQEKFVEKTRVINANHKYQNNILLNEDEHRRLVLGWDEYIKHIVTPNFDKPPKIPKNAFEDVAFGSEWKQKHYRPTEHTKIKPHENYEDYKYYFYESEKRFTQKIKQKRRDEERFF